MSYPTFLSPVEGAVRREREAQDAKWGEQNHPDGTGLTLLDLERAEVARERCKEAAAEGRLTWRDILLEEVAEALAEADPELLRAELVQVAAVAHAWVEALDRRHSCPKCQTPYVVEGHHKTGSNGWCRKCASEYERLRRAANRDAINARRREQLTPERRREHLLRQKYGLTVEAEQRMRVVQNNACAICEEPRELHVDHDHASGQVRGLLCPSCNNGLGRFRDDPERLERAANYLRLTVAQAWAEAIGKQVAE